MFSKTKDSEAVNIPHPQPSAATPSPVAPIKRTTRGNGVPSIISAEVIVRGTMLSSGDLQVDGKVEGDVRAFSLVIGEKSVIMGDVYAEDIIVRGRVEGSICARKVQLCSTCQAVGNILHESLSVEAGAYFEGNCRHSDNPLADAPEMTVPSRPSAPHSPEPRKGAAAHASAAKQPTGDDSHGARPAASYAPLKN
jgi:cytoskeletal protein CcmA (bactofilin family)